MSGPDSSEDQYISTTRDQVKGNAEEEALATSIRVKMSHLSLLNAYLQLPEYQNLKGEGNY